jgi:glutathione synthase/RimK-type ligase-like ATP-grasp enzyme
MKIALVTYQDKGAYHAINVSNEDDLLLNFLHDKGLTITKEIWNDKDVIWEDYDLAIIKSPWDYFDHIAEFYDWLQQMESLNIRLLNPVDILKWNADKRYLNDIKAAGLNITPTEFLSSTSDLELSKYFSTYDCEQIIVKPAVSGGSKNTFKLTKDNFESHLPLLKKLIEQESFIVQPFLKEIETDGEMSFLFFGGKFSHAVLKKAAAGDFRVQATFGGTVHPQNPSAEVIFKAKAYVDLFAKDCLYARVDTATINGELMLMELELIEPFLFLDTDTNALENYYRALSTLL